MDRHRWPLTPRPAPPQPDPASEGRRDLAVLVGAVAICTAAGLVALTALLAAPTAIWWTVGLIAVLAIGGCLAATRRHHRHKFAHPRGAIVRTDRPSDVT